MTVVTAFSEATALLGFNDFASDGRAGSSSGEGRYVDFGSWPAYPYNIK